MLELFAQGTVHLATQRVSEGNPHSQLLTSRVSKKPAYRLDSFGPRNANRKQLDLPSDSIMMKLNSYFRCGALLLLFSSAASTALAVEPRVLESRDDMQWRRGNLHTHSHWSDGDDYLVVCPH